ncbi:MAG: hypothetical protein KAI73_05015 [Rhodospirillaceae bacterium]|nr:hypothetical protein [Rhodospirillaceae bacterium]
MTENTALQAEDEQNGEAQAAKAPAEATESAPVGNEDDNLNDNTDQEEGGEAKAAPFSPEQQAIFDNAIGKKVGATRAAERRAEAAEARAAELEANQPIETRPDIPPMPDQFADGFDEKLKARDQAIAKASAFDTRQEEARTRQEGLDQQATTERQQAVTTVINTYTDRAAKLGITPDELEKSGQAVGAYGLNDAVTLHILGDEKGPAITKFLAENPIAMDKLNGMNPMQAAAHIESVVKPAALKMKKTTNAPPPSTNLDGGGSPPSERGPKGATFE